jgi:hypothetical protein
MINTLRPVFEQTLQRLSIQITAYLPPLLVALAIVAAALVLARLVRLLLLRAIKWVTLDRFLRESGLSLMIDRSGRLRGAELAAGAAYWAILLSAILAAVNVFDTRLTSRMVEATVLLFPKLLTAGVIVLAGCWLSQYLGRGILIWTSNENVPHPRRWAAAGRFLIVFGSVVVAADTLSFAEKFFLNTFLILVGGAVFAGSLALGLGARDAVREFLLRKSMEAAEAGERSLWNHL